MDFVKCHTVPAVVVRILRVNIAVVLDEATAGLEAIVDVKHSGGTRGTGVEEREAIVDAEGVERIEVIAGAAKDHKR